MKKIFAALIATVIVSACSNHPYAKATPHGRVSMISLLAHPSAFAEQQIEVVGYLQHDAGFTLYFDKEHARIVDATSAVAVAPVAAEFIYENCSNRYVRIKATAKVTQDMVTLVDLTNVRDAETMDDCWNKQIEEESGADYSPQ